VFEQDGNIIRKRVRVDASKPDSRAQMDGKAVLANHSGVVQVQTNGAERLLKTTSTAAASGASQTSTRDLEEEAALFKALEAEAAILEAKARQARECPVPKPTGFVGRMLGFGEQGARKTASINDGED
jgi:hypothetical protein